MEVYNYYGPGLLEAVYHKALILEMEQRGLKVESEIPVDVEYKGHKLDMEFRLDLLVDDEIILELKSVEQLTPVHYKQLRSYLKLMHKQRGWLINFGEADFKNGIRKVEID